LATASVPIRLPAPSRFSTITDLPVVFVMPWATVRASTSLPVPAEYGTTILIGRFGKSACAKAGRATMQKAAATAQWMMGLMRISSRRISARP
jgi:hypothetical protein